MTALYTTTEDRWLREKERQAGYASTLEFCVDGIYRTPEEKECYERDAKAQREVLGIRAPLFPNGE